jgi:hypothetical protein
MGEISNLSGCFSAENNGTAAGVAGHIEEHCGSLKRICSLVLQRSCSVLSHPARDRILS